MANKSYNWLTFQFAYHFVQNQEFFETDDRHKDEVVPQLHLVTEPNFPLGDLQSFVTAKGFIREGEVRTIMRQICDGLGLLHREKLAHGDLQLCVS